MQRAKEIFQKHFAEAGLSFPEENWKNVDDLAYRELKVILDAMQEYTKPLVDVLKEVKPLLERSDHTELYPDLFYNESHKAYYDLMNTINSLLSSYTPMEEK